MNLGRRYFSFIAILALALPFCGQADATPLTTSQEFDHAHSLWIGVLEQYVHPSGKHTLVNYRSLKSDQTSLNAYLDSLSNTSESQFFDFTKSQRLAFLINAYNAFTIKLILNYYPVSSIKSIPNAWDTKTFSLLGKQRSLNEIEHDLIRKVFKEPRVHFVLVCAAKSCPPLRREAYAEKRMEQQLQEATASFLGDTTRNRYDPKTNTYHLSAIFDWYKTDFGGNEQSIIAFVTRYLHSPSELAPKTTKVDFLEYDWSLNGTN